MRPLGTPSHSGTCQVSQFLCCCDKTQTKSNLEREFRPDYRLPSIMDGSHCRSSRQKPEQRPPEVCSWTHCPGLLCCLSLYSPDSLPRNSAIHSEPEPPKPINSQENAPQIGSGTNQRKVNSSSETSSFQTAWILLPAKLNALIYLVAGFKRMFARLPYHGVCLCLVEVTGAGKGSLE